MLPESVAENELKYDDGCQFLGSLLGDGVKANRWELLHSVDRRIFLEFGMTNVT